MGSIRFLLALSVLIVHSSPILGVTILPGYLAVQVFYVISGFYMALIYCEKYSNTERPVFYFYSNRILRLYPLYLAVISANRFPKHFGTGLPLFLITILFSLFAYYFILLRIDKVRASRIQ